MKQILFALLAIIVISCKTEVEEVNIPKESKEIAEELMKKRNESTFNAFPVYNFSELEPLLNKADDKTYVVNFWATWCAPCVKELPYFEQLNAAYKAKGVEVILVSLDFPKQYKKKLEPFIEKHKLASKVVALNDTDSNSWIPKVSEDWSGAIPATIIYNKDKRRFYEQSFNYEELQAEVNTFFN